MSIRPQIPVTDGVQDPAAKRVLDALKSVVEMISGRTPDRKNIQTLGPNATLGGVITKINEIIARIQQ